MSITRIFMVAVIAVAGFCSSVEAQTTTAVINFRSGSNNVGGVFDSTPIGTTVTGNALDPLLTGLTVSVVGASNDPNAEINTSGTGIGIDSPGFDDVDGVEVDNGDQLTFTFNQAITVTEVDFSGVVDGDSFVFNGQNLTQANLTSGDTYIPGTPFTIAAGAPVIFAETAGNGITLQDITVLGSGAAVPEPSSLAVLGFGSVLMMVRRRRG